MFLKKPKNSNYAAVVVEIKTLIPLENCDNVQATIIMGNQVIVSNDVKIGDIGLYFPLECQLSREYLSKNNLYRVSKNKPNLNIDTTVKGGYFEENGRVRCQPFRGHKSEGLFMPLDSLTFAYSEITRTNGIFELGDCFDELNGVTICSKYVVKENKTQGTPNASKSKKDKKSESKLIDNQFRFHQDTSMLYRNLHRISPTTLISITYKEHGTSGISSKVLCKKPLKLYEKILKTIGVNIVDTYYDYVYSSRNVIKNKSMNPNPSHFYSEDIWSIAHNEIKDFIQDGMTLYYEIVGYLPNGKLIQKDYDYGCEYGKHKIKIYRITYTNPNGKVFEFSAKQVQDWCKKNGLESVYELYYGYASEFSDERLNEENWRNKFLENIKANYNEKRCFMCKNDVPEEGVVIRIEGLEFEAYKQKSNLFYERETKLLDKGESNIEDEN